MYIFLTGENMKKIHIILIAFFGVIYVLSLILSIFYSSSLNKMMNKEDETFSAKKASYHFVAILHKPNTPYWKGIETGLNAKASEEGVALEVYYTSSDNECTETMATLDMAIASGVEGIIVHGYNTEEFRNLIDKAAAKEIPIVTIDTDCEESKRVSFVGVNSYESGMKMGKEIARGLKYIGKIAVVIENDGVSKKSNVNSIISGIKEAIKDYPDMKVEAIKYSDQGIIGAKSVLQDIINNHKDINGIICTSSYNTIGITQQIVDYNKVGQYVIVGYDNSDEILKYIQKGIIYSTLVPEPLTIGTKGIESLVEKKKSGNVSSLFLTNINVIDKHNVNDFLITQKQQKSR